MKVSVPIVIVMPCYNVAKFCENIIHEVQSFANYLILIDDGSTDSTNQILNKIASEYPQKTKVLTFPHNRGKGFALIEGFKYAVAHFDFKVLLTIDADAQHPAPFIPFLEDTVLEGADLVIGRRQFKEMPVPSCCGNLIISLLLRLMYPESPFDTQSGMRAFNQSLATEITQKISGGRYEMEMECLLLALSQKRNIVEFSISTIYIDRNKSSHFSILKDSWRILKVLYKHWKNRRHEKSHFSRT